MAEESFYITTAIDYTNAPPHIGHAYEKILADVLARSRRAAGRETYFLTGVDQHGQKVQQAAEKRNIPPAEFANEITGTFLQLWEKLGISHDGWAATTDPVHAHAVQSILSDLQEKGQLYKAVHSGFYSIRQEQFLTDKERDEEGNFGPDWGEVVHLEEENWYFRLSEHLPWLEQFLQKHPHAVLPSFRQSELVNAVGKGGGDLCISRPKSRLSWGIELPFDPGFVTYVWFDALINYVSFVGYHSLDAAKREQFERLWPADAHVIGKDILVPAHGVYWLCMLHAMGFSDEQMPTLLVHGWWNLGGAKVSKSLGNVVDPGDLIQRFGVSAVRYYLMRDISLGRDADFSEERLIVLYHSELANGLGNLLNRALNMTWKYREGVLQPLPESKAEKSVQLLAIMRQSQQDYAVALKGFDVQKGIEAAGKVVAAANGYAEAMAPWKLAKDPDQAVLLDEVLSLLALAARLAASLLAPVIPEASEKILGQLRLPLCGPGGEDCSVLPPDHLIDKAVPVFPRLEESSDSPA